MIKEIKYRGYTAVPSDYESSDGELSTAINLIPEDGDLKIINQPVTLQSLAPYDCLCIHKAGNKDWLILYSEHEYPGEDKVGEIYSLQKGSNQEPSIIVSGFQEKPSVAILGNTLVISDGTTTAYILYSVDHENYIYLGNSLPEISPNLALSYEPQADDSYLKAVTIGIPEGYSTEAILKIFTVFSNYAYAARGRNGTNSSTKTDAFISTLSDAVLGFLNKMNAEASEENKFIQPFLLRWALRLYDGSYIHQSAPILMIPNSGTAELKYTASVEDTILTINLRSNAKRCTIMIKPSGLTNLSKWTDIIKSIDFFVSSPIYTYDQSGTVEAIGRRSSAEIFSHSGWSQRINATRTDNDDENHHRQPPTFDPDLIPQYKFIDGNTEQWLSQEKPSLVPPQFSREHIESGITSVANFYLISSLPLTGEDAISDLDAFTPLAINEKALSTLNSRPTLPDDWRSHEVIHFKTSYPYNSRLTLAGVSSSLFRGFSIPDMGQYWENHDSQDLNCTIWVKLIRNFKSYWISTTSSLPGGRLPRFLFYPDPSAVEMRVICEDGSGWQLPLTTHDFLNGSYWFDGLAKERTPKKDNVEAPIQSESIAEEPSKLFLSEVNNPFYFPVEGRISVGSGRILGISSSAKALSQGQFGQFPLYAFTTEGVWAMELSSTGTYTARQPISRDVCTNPDAITQIDSAVLFPTNRGIMLISGSQVQCISDIIDNPANINALNLPFLNRLHTMAGHDTDSCFPLVPFLEFVSGCGMIYDYIHQRIFIFNKAYNYAYVYSLKSQQWGMTFSRISHSVNSYPEAMAIDLDGNLVNFSKENTIRETGLLVTRPIKLDDRDILKTIQTVIQRGKFRKGHIKSVLYGSRDLYNWHMISSSKTHQLSGFSGSPYKFFRLALICNLAIDESLTGCTIQYNERLTNKLR